MIVSCLLTRRCNLRCEYCKLVKNYDDMPHEYPKMEDYKSMEKNYIFWCKVGDFFKTKNPNSFMLLYGGEPTLYKDLEKIIDYYNEKNIMYSVITNATNPDLICSLAPKLFGITTSIDPGTDFDHRKLKSQKGLKLLKDCIAINKNIDAVAEVVLDNKNYKNLEWLINEALSTGFRLSITIIETGMNKYYDFTDDSAKELLLNEHQCQEIIDTIEKYDFMYGEKLFIAPYAIKEVLKRGSQQLFCDPTKENAYAIDTDGRVRLCLRIRGIEVPKIDLEKYIENKDIDGFTNEFFDKSKLDMANLCDGCSWTCAEMKDATLRKE